MSVMCSRPSRPSRSTNTPKSVMFFTRPMRRWPLVMEASSSRFLSAWRSSISSRRETMMLRRSGLILMTLNSNVWLMYGSTSCTGAMSTCEPGRNASMPSMLTIRPPRTRLLMTPVTTAPSWYLVSTASQRSLSSAWRLLSETMPFSPSSSTSSTSMTSPGLTTEMSSNSLAGTMPSDL